MGITIALLLDHPAISQGVGKEMWANHVIDVEQKSGVFRRRQTSAVANR